MRFGVAAKADDPNRTKIARYVCDYLKSRAEVVVQQELAKHLPGEVEAVALEDMKVDVVVTIGGDGTILHALQVTDAPLFGINMGEIGFLTEAEPIELPDALDRVLTGDYFVEQRLKLATRVNGEPVPDALNEAVLKTGRPSKMLHFKFALNGTEVQRVRADGVVVATPTGSTSYAMSAGGPIMDPRVEALLVVPIAPFSLESRPIVFPTSSTLDLRLQRRSKDAVLVIDGQYEQVISPEDVIECTGSPTRARFVRFHDTFYPRIKERLA